MLKVEIENDLVVVTSETGKVAHRDLIETFAYVESASSTFQGKNVLFLDPASDYSPSSVELQQLVSSMKPVLEKTVGRIALVVSKEFHFGIGRMIEAFADESAGEFRVFKDEESARDWLADPPA